MNSASFELTAILILFKTLESSPDVFKFCDFILYFKYFKYVLKIPCCSDVRVVSFNQILKRKQSLTLEK